MRRRLFTPRQRHAYRRQQLLRDLILGAVVVAIAQLLAPHLPLVQELEALPVSAPAPAARVASGPALVGTSPTATAQTPPRFAPIEFDRGR